MLVSFTYKKNGRIVPMKKRFAEILQKLGHGHYTESTTAAPKKPVVNTPPPLDVIEPEAPLSEAQDAAPQEPVEPEAKALLVSAAAKKLAEEFKVSLELLTGTGANGQITKTDVENYIDSRV